MLKRIAVVSEDAKLVKAAQKALDGREDILLSAVAPGETSPCPVSGVLAPATQVQHALPVLAQATGEHEALFTLVALAVDAREGHAAGSCTRLCDHAVRLATAMKLTQDEINTIERGALLHDVGKLRVSNEVLMKKSLLSYDEWLELQAHTTKGAVLLREFGFEEPLLEIVHRHHEAWDGDGYPGHLEREAIPLFARIMKICDVFTAMTSPRHYRPGIPSIQDALDHLAAERGKHFDPELIDIFLEHNIGRPWPSA